MKRVVYSIYTKVAAVCLCIICIVTGTAIALDGLSKCAAEQEIIYSFEYDFLESVSFSSILHAPEQAVYNAYQDFFDNYGEKSTKGEKNQKIIRQNIEDALGNLDCADKIDYYVKWNDAVYTNCNASDVKELLEKEVYSYVKKDGSGHIERKSAADNTGYHAMEELSAYDSVSPITICTGIKDDYVDACRTLWEQQEKIVINTLREALRVYVAAVVLFLYLVCVCGKNENGEKKTIWVDNIWVEIHLTLIGLVGVTLPGFCYIWLKEYLGRTLSSQLTKMIVCSAAAVWAGILLVCLLSIVRSLKSKRFLQSCITYRIAKWGFGLLNSVVRWFFRKCKIIGVAAAKKTGAMFLILLFSYTAFIGLCGIIAVWNADLFWIFAAVIVFFVSAAFLAARIRDLEEIKTGVSRIRKGETEYKIGVLKHSEMNRMAEDVNEIAQGIQESVAAKVKAERLKTELITNVSHDLKTPITSIINYSELLLANETLTEETRNYVQIISKKGERLKKLTQDLFDISKVQSGNEEVIFEKLDAGLLINQALGEYDSEIEKAELVFCTDIQKELYFMADGRKMSRVVSNLIQNMLKYSMKNTRVFLSVSEKEGKIVMEFKNIASYPMDFQADEIMERFVRGDASRSIEGNGLGLAIAKSYVEVCGGEFNVVTDGDMFKAIIVFSQWKQ